MFCHRLARARLPSDAPLPRRTGSCRGPLRTDERSCCPTCAGNGPWTGTASLKPAGVRVRDRIRTPDGFPTG